MGTKEKSAKWIRPFGATALQKSRVFDRFLPFCPSESCRIRYIKSKIEGKMGFTQMRFDIFTLSVARPSIDRASAI